MEILFEQGLTKEYLFKVLNRRSNRKSYSWESFNEMLKYYKLPYPKIYFCMLFCGFCTTIYITCILIGIILVLYFGIKILIGIIVLLAAGILINALIKVEPTRYYVENKKTGEKKRFFEQVLRVMERNIQILLVIIIMMITKKIYVII